MSLEFNSCAHEDQPCAPHSVESRHGEERNSRWVSHKSDDVQLKSSDSYLTVEDDEEGYGDEGAEEDSQIGGEGDLVGKGHGGEGVHVGESRGGNEGRSKTGNCLRDIHLHGHGTRLDHGAGSTYNAMMIQPIIWNTIRSDCTRYDNIR